MSGQKLGFGTRWDWEQWRNGKLLKKWNHGNICTDEGIASALDVAFSGATPITAWYIAPFENDHTPATGDSYATPGYTEATAYSEANRQQWQEAGVAALALTNSANKASFTMSAAKTIYGAGLVGGGTDADTKGDAAGGGVLFASGSFGSSVSLASGDVLKVTVTLTGSDV